MQVRRLKVAILTTDNREQHSRYERTEPYFGTAIEALLQGLPAFAPEVEVHVLSCVRKRMQSPVKLAENIWFHEVIVPKIGWGRMLFLGCALAVRRKLREIRPDIVHGQGTERDCAMSAVHSGRPSVITIHGNMGELHRLGLHGSDLYGRLAARLEAHALKRCRGVFCNSTYTEGLVREHAATTWLVPNAIRAQFFAEGQMKDPREEVPMLLNIGVISARKRQLELLRLVTSMNRRGMRLRMTFVGNLGQDDYSREFSTALAEAERGGWASYEGHLGTDDLIALMDRCQGLIHFPSEEAFGLVVPEAMARSLKFFGSDLGGVREIARDVPGAELHTTFESLERGIETWLKSGAGRSPFAAGIMAERYAPAVVARRHLEIYREVLSQEHGVPA